MKITLEFNSNEEEFETQEAINAINAGKVLGQIWEFKQWLRSELKWNDKLSTVEYELLEKVRDKFNELVPIED